MLLDRYVIKQIIPPTGLGLLLFTFVLVLDHISQLMKILVSRGADLATVVKAFLYILPSIFSVTIPMAFLLGVLLAFGRMASDSEIVALRASGVSPARLLKPVMALSALVGLLTFYVVAVALPAANQAYREVVFALVLSKARTGVLPRVFNDDLLRDMRMVLYVSDIPAETGEWRDVFLYDDRDPKKPAVILAHSGRLEIDKGRKTVTIRLQRGVIHSFGATDAAAYERLDFESRDLPLPFDQFFPKIPLAKGDREMSLSELKSIVHELRQAGKGRKETGRYEVEYHKKFAIAAACIVFGLLGLSLSLGARKEARSSAFGLSIAIIFIYYVLIRLGEQAGDTGMLSPFLAMWGANIVLGAAAIVLLGLNHSLPAFDPLDPRQCTALLGRFRRRREAEIVRRSPARPRSRPVVVVRIPRASFPLPGLLDRYIARNYVGKFGLVVAAFLALFLLGDFIDLFDDIQTNRVKGSVVLHYYLFKTPDILRLSTPPAVLVAVLVTFGLMARRNEITAMKAAGISVYRATLPLLALGGLIALTMFGAMEYVLPSVNRVAKRDFNVIKGRPPEPTSLLDRKWVLGSSGRLYHYDYVEAQPAGTTLYNLFVFDLTAQQWELRDLLHARRAVWNGISYDLEEGWWRGLGSRAGFHQFTQSRTRDIDPPTHFKQEERAADTLRWQEMRAHIARLEKLGLDVIPLRVQLQQKMAFPLICVVMTLLGIPFAFVVARRGALYGVAASIVLAIVYWACQGIFDALGSNASLPPFLAAWAPNLLFGGAGLYLMFTMET
jgi:LPS export ABC transporter permease LptF/LPS export ABC transporter permease LptG